VWLTFVKNNFMQPIGNNYLVKRTTTKPKNDIGAFTNQTPTPGAMNMNDTKAEDVPSMMKGDVIEVGVLQNKEDKHVCKKGDKIMFRHGEPIEVDGKDYLIVSGYDIKLVL
jgi:co-chaperonin GroES (HSP10)